MSSPIRGFFRYICRLLTGKTGSKKSKIRILSVGVGNSRKFGSCPGACMDASSILDKVDAGRKVLLLDRQATRSSVLNELREGVSGTDDDGLFVFFFSGHGGQVRSSDKSETDGKDETLCLWDGELVDNQIWSVLQSARCRVFMVTDCCNSGTNYMVAGPFRVLELSRLQARGSSSPRLLHWGGCGDGAYSYGDDTGGVMTNAILKLVGKGFSYKRAFDRVFSACKGSQTPSIACIGFDQDVELFK